MIFIAHKSRSGNKIGIKEIAKGINAPEHFIAKIMQDLSKNKLVQSSKGPNGGFYFKDDQVNISIADIVKAIDGDKIFVGCILGLHQCSESRPCPVHHKFKGLRASLFDMLQDVKLHQFEDYSELNLTHFQSI